MWWYSGFIGALQWAAVCIAAAVWLAYIFSHKMGQHEPRNWPLVGMLPSVIANFHRIYDWETEVLRAAGGTYIFRGPWKSKQDSVISCDPRNIEYVLHTNFSNFPKGEDFHAEFYDLLGDGIFNADGPEWRRLRSAAAAHFYSPSFRRFSADTVTDIVHARLVPILAAAAETGAAVDLQDVFLRFTFDNTCTVVFGRSPGSLAPDLPPVAFSRAFDDAVEATFYRHLTPRPLWKLLRRLKLGKERQFHKALKPLREFVDELIAFKKKTMREGGRETKDLLSHFMADESRYDDKFLRDAVMNLVIAGRDTSGVALAWFFFLLHRHPSVEHNILHELYAVLSTRQQQQANCPLLDHQIIMTAAELDMCVYLTAALTETLRLYPSIPHDHKGVLNADVLPDGTCIQPGMRFLYSIYSLGRMDSIWGPDCMDFNPERWLHHDQTKTECGYKFMAFNGGQRVCLGKEMAYKQMKAAAAAVILRFRVRVVPESLENVKPKLSLVLAINNGLHVTLHKRSSMPFDASNATHQSFSEI